MSTLSLSLIQSIIHWEDRAANLEMYEQLMQELNPKTDLVMLPEMFTTGFSMNAKEFADEAHGETFQWMKKMALQHDVAITGSFIAKEADMFFNRLLFFSPDGSYQQYDKKHLFRMAEEQNYYTPGRSRTIVHLKDWRIVPLICYDLRFPSWSRNHYHPATGELDYDLLLYVANWPAPRANIWDTLLKARSIENHCYVAGANRLGGDGAGVEYAGHSAVYGPRGETFAYSVEEEILFASLSKDDLSEYRERFPAYLDSQD